jgi:nitroimidazol reductase NimA-like FMN-containing flavoprotein (pyridoxamine 5'-phosphate oxidase superfamily)
MTRHGERETPGRSVEADSGGELRVLREDECASLLRGARLGRLAFAVGGQTSIFPVNYLYDGTSIVMRTAPGFKLQEAPMRAAAFEIDDAGPDGTWGWSVVAQGPCYDISSSMDDISEQLRELPLRPWAPGAREHWLRIAPHQITGRAFGTVPERRPA